MNKETVLNKLLKILSQYLKIEINLTKNYSRNRQIFRGLCNQCLTLYGIDKDFYTLQDSLLSMEREENGIVEVEKFSYKDNIAHFNGDITRLKADAIVNAANDNYLGCFVPCHNCIDNVIMSAAGFQMREELLQLKKDKDYTEQKVKVTKGYNLSSDYVFHVAGPIVGYKVTEKDIKDLKNCYLYCLETAKKMKLKNIVFCCISTGEYHFPNALACDIAVTTVKEWLKANKNCLKIVFNTFKEIDKEIYDDRLSNKNW